MCELFRNNSLFVRQLSEDKSRNYIETVLLKLLIPAMANLDHRGLIGRINVGDHYTLLHTKYKSCVPDGFREEDFFKVFPVISLWELYVSMAIRVPIQSAQKPYATYPPV